MKENRRKAALMIVVLFFGMCITPSIIGVEKADLILNNDTPLEEYYTLDVTVIYGGGDVIKDPDWELYPEGTVVELTPIPWIGWLFDGWSGPDADEIVGNKITMTKDMEVTAWFCESPIGIEILVVGNGFVTKDPDQATYTYGTVVILTAFPDPGWTFDHWSGDLDGNENPTDVELTESKYVTAHFIEIEPPVISNVVLTTSDPLDTWPDFGWENVTCTVTDDGDGVDEVKIVITDPNMVTTEHLMIKTGTDTYYYNTTLTIVGEYSYYIWANDTANNIATTTPETFIVYDNWDINRDGEIRLVDFVLIAGHYGENGPPGWIREDVDNDGKVRLLDFVLVAGHYGEG